MAVTFLKTEDFRGNGSSISEMMLVNPVQSENASSNIHLTELGMVMVVRPVQFWNAPAAINLIELGSKTEVIDVLLKASTIRASTA